MLVGVFRLLLLLILLGRAHLVIWMMVLFLALLLRLVCSRRMFLVPAPFGPVFWRLLWILRPAGGR